MMVNTRTSPGLYAVVAQEQPHDGEHEGLTWPLCSSGPGTAQRW